MSALSRLLTLRVLVVVLLLVLVGGLLLGRDTSAGQRTLTAYFPSVVSIYEGSDVRVLGVNVGRVTAVEPDGDAVRVEITYDDEYRIPADAKAAIVTPTLVADRFVQLSPAFAEGDDVMADGGEIALPDTGVPVELDRIYAALRDLTSALGPQGANADGTLDRTLRAGARALDGNGELGNEMLNNLSEAAVTFGQGSGDLFETVEQLAVFTDNLARNDELVRAFVADLAGVSRDLVEEREELQAALSSVADTVGVVQRFVADNRGALVSDVEKLTRVMKNINSERESINTALTVAPVAMGNLVLAFNTATGSIGSRIGFEGNVADADGLLCAVVQQSDLPAVSKNLSCELFEQLLEPLLAEQGGNVRPPSAPGAAGASGASGASGAAGTTGTAPRAAPRLPEPAPRVVRGDDTSLTSLLGGAS